MQDNKFDYSIFTQSKDRVAKKPKNVQTKDKGKTVSNSYNAVAEFMGFAVTGNG